MRTTVSTLRAQLPHVLSDDLHEHEHEAGMSGGALGLSDGAGGGGTAARRVLVGHEGSLAPAQHHYYNRDPRQRPGRLQLRPRRPESAFCWAVTGLRKSRAPGKHTVRPRKAQGPAEACLLHAQPTAPAGRRPRGAACHPGVGGGRHSQRLLGSGLRPGSCPSLESCLLSRQRLTPCERGR